jgi:lipoprotein-releasing system permease protein
VTFGIAMFIALVSFMNGLNEMVMLNRTPHVRLYNEVPAENQPLDYQLTINKTELYVL